MLILEIAAGILLAMVLLGILTALPQIWSEWREQRAIKAEIDAMYREHDRQKRAAERQATREARANMTPEQRRDLRRGTVFMMIIVVLAALAAHH